MKNIKKYLLLLLIGTSFSCTKDFNDLNTDPNQSLKANTKLLFGSAITGIAGNIDGSGGLLYVQHMAEFIYNQESLYTLTQYNYDDMYYGPLMDLQTIININNDLNRKNDKDVLANSSNENQIGHARILKAFFMLHITDRWGDVPYTEANKGINIPQPKFDKQKFIYNDLLKELKEAIAQVSEPMANDALFDGDYEKWIRWANSLRAIIALRMIKTEDALIAKAAFTDAIADGIMVDNSDNAIFNYLSNVNYESPWYTNYITTGRIDYGASQRVVDNELVVNNDPRLPIFSRTIGSPAVYTGIPYGTADRYEAGVDGALLGRAIYAQNYPLQITTYAQMCFTMAEAVLEGWIPGGDAVMVDWYNKGIDASMDQWSEVSTNPKISITAIQKTAYISQPNIDLALAVTHDEKLAKIQNQKWLNFYMSNGYEAWAEWRRTGYPVLTPAPDAVNEDKQIPRRQCYPKTESDLNNANYRSAVAAQGPDKLSTHVWWDR